MLHGVKPFVFSINHQQTTINLSFNLYPLSFFHPSPKLFLTLYTNYFRIFALYWWQVILRVMRKIFLTAAIAIFAISLHAQLVQDLYRIYEPVYRSSKTDSAAVFTPFGIVKPGINYGLSMGTGYSFLGNGIGMSGSYIAPSVTYSNNRLQVIAGVTLSRTNMHGLKPDGANFAQPYSGANPYQAWAYTQYQFSNRFSVFAMGSVSQNQSFFSPYQNYMGTYNSQQFGVGFNYRLGPKTTIGASLNFVNRNPNNLFYNPYSPFSW